MRKFITELWPLTPVRILFPHNILRMNQCNLTTFYICIYIDKILVEIIMQGFANIFIKQLLPLTNARISFPLNILKTNSLNFTIFCICIDIDKNKVEIITH